MRVARPLSLAFLAGVIVGISGTTVGATLSGSAVFSDVQPGSYYDSAIGELYNAGIIKGLSADRFGPNDYITRGQVAVLMQRLRDELQGTVATSSSSRSTASSVSSTSTSSSSSSSSVTTRPAQGSFRLTSNAYTAAENSGTLTVSVVRVGGAKGQSTVNYSIIPGNATPDADYTPITGTLVFADASTAKTLSIAILNDTLSEGSETMTLSLTTPTGGAIIESPTSATITITDDEAPSSGSSSSATSSTSSATAAGTIEFGAPTYSVAENDGNIIVTVLRTGGTTGNVSAAYTTTNGTATSGTYYTAVSGTVSFSTGETSKTITVPVLNNTSIEGAKKFTVNLATPTGGAVLGTAVSTVTILDDDTSGFEFGSGSIKFASATATVKEGDAAAITVTRVGGTKGTVSVSYSTYSSGLAAAGDYTTTSGTLTFLPGEASKIIRVQTTKDSTSDPGEDFTLQLSSPSSNTTLLEPSAVVVTIDQ